MMIAAGTLLFCLVGMLFLPPTWERTFSAAWLRRGF
jgi:hypothetical protein